jgi:hypothetical protein
MDLTWECTAPLLAGYLAPRQRANTVKSRAVSTTISSVVKAFVPNNGAQVAADPDLSPSWRVRLVVATEGVDRTSVLLGFEEVANEWHNGTLLG